MIPVRHVLLTLVGLFLFIGCGTTAETTNTTQAEVVTITHPSDLEGLQVGIVISPDSATQRTYFLTAGAQTSTALDALNQVQIDMVTQDYGWAVAICSISGVGHPPANCLGDLGDPFWSLFIRPFGGDWEQAVVGVDQQALTDGDLLGLVYTPYDANFDPVRQPPDITWETLANP